MVSALFDFKHVRADSFSQGELKSRLLTMPRCVSLAGNGAGRLVANNSNLLIHFHSFRPASTFLWPCCLFISSVFEAVVLDTENTDTDKLQFTP